MRTVVLTVVLLLALLARAPWLARPATETERAHAGAARHLVLQRDRAPPPLTLDPPLASWLGSPIQWSLRSPAPEYDPAGPPDQIGWLTVRDTTLPTGEVVAPWIVVACMRLPFVLLHLVGVFLVFRVGERFYGPAAGAVAAAITALAAEPALTGAAASPAALALPVTALLLAALDDAALAVGYAGSAPPWLLRKRTLAGAVACGLALATSFAFLPVVLVATLWLLRRRRAMEQRGDPCQPPSFGRLVAAVLVTALVVWGVYAGDLAPWPEADLTLPAPLWWSGAFAAGRDALAAPAAERTAALRAVGGPTLLGVAVLAAVALPWVWRDRTDTPSLLLSLGLAAVATSVVAAPRHAEPAVAAALPPLALLAGAGLVRLARNLWPAAAGGAALLLVVVAAGWQDRRPWTPAEEPPDERPAALQADELWLLRRWIGSRRVPRVVTVLGRDPLLRATGSSVVEEVAADDARLRAVLKEVDGGDVALVVGGWMRTPSLPALDGREPDARFGRLVVFGRR